MTHQGVHPYTPGLADAGGQVAQLRQVLALVSEIAGAPGPGGDAALDEAARISSAYEAASPVAQRCFDLLAEETERWAAGGVETLIALRDRERPCAAAAARLAAELETALGRLREAVSA
jgi:ABC-type transporter Mla subunit MlaD